MLITRKSWIFLLIILLITLTGCFDLGSGYSKSTEDESDEEAYYDSFGAISFLDTTGSESSYSMSDFYNEETVNNYACVIEAKEYTYLGIEFKNGHNIGEVAIHFNCAQNVTLGVSFYLVNIMPSKITYTDSAGKLQNLMDSDEPEDDKKVGSTSVRLSANRWNCAYLQSWSNGGKLSVSDGQILLVRIENNCYSTLKKELEKARTNMEKANQTYQTDLAEYNRIASSGSQAEIEAARRKMEASLAEYNKAKATFDAASKKYDEEKNPYDTRASVRITDILIYAE